MATTRYNPAYSGFFESEARYALLWGGRGSGKSYATAQKFVMRCLQNDRERILVYRKVLKSCRTSTFQLIRDVLSDMRIEATVNRVDMHIAFPRGSHPRA